MKKLLLTLTLSFAALPVYADELTPTSPGGEDLPPPRATAPQPVDEPAVSAPAPVVATPPSAPQEPVRAPAAPTAAAPATAAPAAMVPAARTAGSKGFGGLYAGGSVGYVFANTDVHLDTPGPATTYNFDGMGGEGGSLGLHAGWGTMFGPSGKTYAGIEAGYQVNNDVEASSKVSGLPLITVEVDNSWQLSGRLGYLVAPETMLYGRAGLVRTKLTFSYAGTPAFKDDDRANGLVLGLGVEHRFAQNLSLRGEYAYLNHKDVDFNRMNGAANALKVENNSGLFHIGLSYLF